MSNEITITVFGPAASGKSAIISEIETTLRAKGLSVVFDDEEGDHDVVTANREIILAKLVERDTKIKIVQVQQTRVPEPA